MTPERNLIEAVGKLIDVLERDQHYFGDEYQALKDAYAATPKPEPGLRWEGHSLHLGGVKVGEVWRAIHQWGWVVSPNAKELEGFVPTKAEARTAAEQAVRDWLKRAGVV